MSHNVKACLINIDLSRDFCEVDAIVERLREFIRFNYMTASEVARRLGERDSTVYFMALKRNSDRRTRNASPSS
jgi:hypothetical protein